MTRQDSVKMWAAVHKERHALIADLAPTAAEQWMLPSLCPGWTVHDVLAHLVDSAKTTRLSFALRLILARFDFDRDNAAGVIRERAATPADTLNAFRRVANLTKTPPAPFATRLVEAIVHGEDLRRPLGIAHHYAPEAVATALQHQLVTDVHLGGGRERASAFRIVCNDSDRWRGDGPEVKGSTLSLLLAVCGRPVDLSELTGEGAAAFAAQFNRND